MKNLRELNIGANNVMWQFLCKLYDHFFGTYDVDENNFSKKGFFPE